MPRIKRLYRVEATEQDGTVMFRRDYQGYAAAEFRPWWRRRWSWALLYRDLDNTPDYLYGRSWTRAGADAAITRAADRLRAQHGGAA